MNITTRKNGFERIYIVLILFDCTYNSIAQTRKI